MTGGTYRRIAPQARNIAPELEPNEDDIATEYLNPLRKLTSKTEERLVDEGFHRPRTGVECVSVRTWKDNRFEGYRGQTEG